MLALPASELGEQHPRQGAADVGPGEAHHDGHDALQGQDQGLGEFPFPRVGNPVRPGTIYVLTGGGV